MARLKRVLAATDFSPFSRHAVERAAFIASSVGAELDLLHVLSLAPLQDLEQLMADLPPGFADTVIAAARAELQAVADDLAARRGVNVTCRVACGPLLATLHAESVASQADLLVLGARGESGVFRNMVLGTTAARMISKARQPILVVKQPVRGAYRNVLAPVDFSPSTLHSLRLAQRVAPEADTILMHAFDVPFESRLRFANVSDDVIGLYCFSARQRAQESLGELREQSGLAEERTRFSIVQGDASQHVIEQEQDFDCDLIVVGKHGRSPLEDLIVGSVTRKVLAESRCDILVFVE